MEITPEKPARWSLNFASAEFGCARETLRTALRQAGQSSGDDECYSTRQICAALFGDLKAERTGLTRAQRESKELENKKASGQLIDVDDAIAINHKFTFAIRQKILMAPIDDKTKNSILLELQQLREVDFNNIDPDDVEDSKAAG